MDKEDAVFLSFGLFSWSIMHSFDVVSNGLERMTKVRLFIN